MSPTTLSGELVWAICGGLAVLIGAVVKAIMDIKSTKTAVVAAASAATGAAVAAVAAHDQTMVSRDEGKVAGDARDAKLDAIGKSTDGNMSIALSKINALEGQNEMLLDLLKRLSRGEIGPPGVGDLIDKRTAEARVAERESIITLKPDADAPKTP